MDTKQYLALSAAQLGVWHAQQGGASVLSYNSADYTLIRGAIDPKLFETALRQVVAATEALRVRIVERDNVLSQLVTASFDWAMTYQDVSLKADPAAAAGAWMSADLARPIDVRDGPFFSYALFKTAPEEFLWYARHHHIVMDGYGAALIAQRVAEVYSALVNGLPIDCGAFGSLAALEEEDAAYRASKGFEADRRFWLDSMSGYPEPLTLSFRKSTPTAQFLRLATDLPSATVTQLRDFAGRVQLSVPQLATAAVAIFVHRLTQAEDVVLGQLLTARMTAISTQTPAMMTNIVPMRLAIEPTMSVGAVMNQTRRRALQGLRHQLYRIADLRRDLRRVAKPIFGPKVIVRPFHVDLQFAGHSSSNHAIANGPADDLDFHFVTPPPGHGAFRIEFNANPALYDQEDLARLQRRFLRLLAALDDPDELIGRLDILPPEERQEILTASNHTPSDHSGDRQVHELFETQVEQRPDAVAVVFGESGLTYRDLNRRANQLAHRLRNIGVAPDALVGLCVERSLEMVVGMLGILKAGAAYLPLDPIYPKERLAFMLSDARPKVILTQRHLQDLLPADRAKRVVLDLQADLFSDESAENPGRIAQPDHLAYVIYTSGSTGTPKGVLVTRKNVARLFHATKSWYCFGAEDVWTLFHSYAFDFSVWEMWGALAYGGRLVVVPHLVARSPEEFYQLLRKEYVTVLNQTPSAFRRLIRTEQASEKCDDLALRLIIFGGEALEMQSLTPWFERHGDRHPRLVNMYGITETTVHVTYRPLAVDDLKSGSVIGIPIPDLRLYILDKNHQLAPIGIVGEMFVGGAGVARGYLNRPELTREKFIDNPFSDQPGERLYRSGDLARYLPDGDIEYLGRMDDQVKIRGFRIELGEIESVLAGFSGVREAVVAVREDIPGDKQLVAYLTVKEGEPPRDAELRGLLRTKLPEYMTPSAFVTLDRFPLTPNGKVDRKALPAPAEGKIETEHYVAPTTYIEQVLGRIFRERLNLVGVGTRDNFFDLGGYSLHAVRTVGDINKALKAHLNVPAFFQNPTIEGLAKVLEQQHLFQPELRLVPLQPGHTGLPLYFIGSSLVEHRIARLIGEDRAIVGIDAPMPTEWLDAIGAGNQAALPTIEQLGALYGDALSAYAGSSPCVVVGCNFAGMIAFEAARVLQRAGGNVAFVLLIDAFTGIGDHRVQAWRSLLSVWRTATETADDIPYIGRVGAALGNYWRLLRWLLARALGAVKTRLAVATAPSGMPSRLFDKEGVPFSHAVMNRFARISARSFHPHLLDASGVLIRAQYPTDEALPGYDFTNGWGGLFAQGLEIVQAKGGHVSIVDDENAAALGRQINAALDRYDWGKEKRGAQDADRTVQLADTR